MDENRYNTRVRHAISDKLIECRNIRGNFVRRREWIINYLEENKDTITYKEYTKLERELKDIEKENERLKICEDIWDQAREVCLDIADEMCKEKKEN